MLKQKDSQNILLNFLKYYVISFLLIPVSHSSAQVKINSIEERIFTDRAESLIKNYFEGLTTIGLLSEEDKDLFIETFIESNFENGKVIICNDIDLAARRQTELNLPMY